MSPVKFCPEHGPYDASFDACPQCGGAPAQSRSLNEMDELETDIGTRRPPTGFGAGASQGDETFIPGRSNVGGGYTSPTMLSSEMGRAMDQTQLDGYHPALVEAILWVKSGNRRGKYYPINHGTVIGRKEGDLILDDLTVSGTHAKITRDGDKYTLWDFGSANGTFVNKKRIREATPITENDEIKVGDTVFVLKLLSEKKPTPKKKASSTAKKTSSTAKKTTSTAKKSTSAKSTTSSTKDEPA